MHKRFAFAVLATVLAVTVVLYILLAFMKPSQPLLEGTYFSLDDPRRTIEFHQDGIFYAKQPLYNPSSGEWTSFTNTGRWEIRGDEVILTIGEIIVTKTKISGNSLIDADGQVCAKQSSKFNGPNLNVDNITFGYGTITVTLKNNGDFPAYIGRANATLADINFLSDNYFLNELEIPPNTAKNLTFRYSSMIFVFDAWQNLSPGPHTLTLNFKEYTRNDISISIGFTGAKLAISNLKLSWEYSQDTGNYTLTGLSFNVANSGDLPIAISKCKITIGNETVTHRHNEPFLPADEITVYMNLGWGDSIMGITPESKPFKIELENTSNVGIETILCSYVATVTPGQ